MDASPYGRVVPTSVPLSFFSFCLFCCVASSSLSLALMTPWPPSSLRGQGVMGFSWEGSSGVLLRDGYVRERDTILQRIYSEEGSLICFLFLRTGHGVGVSLFVETIGWGSRK